MTPTPGGQGPGRLEQVRQLEQGTDLPTVLALFDALPPIKTAGLHGAWRGSEIPTGHPLDGLLTRLGWWGKVFEDDETVHPLVFIAPGGEPCQVDPARLPLRAALAVPQPVRAALAPTVFRVVFPALRTTRAAARLRMVEHRGEVSAAMVYDAQPIVDHFRAVDRDCVLGLMDQRGVPPFPFLLRRMSTCRKGRPSACGEL